MIAKCAWWDAIRGFGFLSPINGSEDIFCHHSGLAFGKPGYRNLERGCLVEFEISERDGRTVAKKVRLIEDENAVSQAVKLPCSYAAGKSVHDSKPKRD